MRPTLEFPLLRRELLANLRTRRAFWLLLVVVTIAGVAPLFAWPQPGALADPEENAIRFCIFTITQLSVALLVTPAFTATAFTTEREENTFELLFSTLLPRWSIAASKLLSSSGYLLLLLVACLPAVSLLYLLGGLEFAVLVDCYVITVVALVTSTLICLTASLRARSTASAVVRSYFALVFWNGGLTMLLMLLSMVIVQIIGTFRGPGPPVWYVTLAGTTPFSAITYSIFKSRIPGGIPTWWSFESVYLVYAGCVAAGHAVYLLWRARSPYTIAEVPKRRRAGADGRVRPFRRTWLTRRLMRLGERGVPGFANPLFQKELRSEFFSRVRYRWVVFWLALVVGGLILAGTTPRDADWLAGVSFTTLVFSLLLAPAVSATGMTRESEQGHLDLLRGTRLSTAELVRGKYFSSLYANAGLLAPPLWLFAFSLLFGVPGSYGPDQLDSWLHTFCSGYVVLLVAYAFAAAVGLVGTVIARRSIGALLIAYGCLLLLNLGYPLAAEILDVPSSFWRSPFGRGTHPFVAMECAVARWRWRDDAKGLLFNSPVEWFVVLYGGATVGLVYLASWIGARRLSRDS